MQFARNVAGRVRPPAFFSQTDPVFACNDATPGQDLYEEIVERVLDFFAHCCVAIYRSAMMLTWMLPSPA